jgi:peptide/nickel transport system permease protein
MTDSVQGRVLAAEAEEVELRHRSLWLDVWHQFRSHKGAMAGVGVFAFIVLAVLLGPYIHDIDPQYLDYRAKNQGMSLAHPMGTDNLGRDMFAQVLAGGRTSLAVGVTAMALSLSLGTLVGVIAGFFARLDGVLMRLTDLFLALPILPLLLVIIMLFRDTLRSLFGPEIGIFILIVFVIGITSWMQTARIVRGEVLAIKEREFVLAARSIGTRSHRMIFRDPRGGGGDHHRKRAQFPRPRLSLGLPDLGPVAVRRRAVSQHQPRPGNLAGAGDIAHRVERELYRRRVARRA